MGIVANFNLQLVNSKMFIYDFLAFFFNSYKL